MDADSPSPNSKDPRKRTHDAPHHHAEQGLTADQDHFRQPKRTRSSNWSLRASRQLFSQRNSQVGGTMEEQHQESEAVGSLTSAHSTEMTTQQNASVRPARFHEGSMNDKPSAKPPSVFTRAFHTQSTANLAVDRLMDDYHAEASSGAISAHANSNHNNKTKNRGSTRSEVYWDGSTYRASQLGSTSLASTESKQSGILRFGRSVVSAINPIQAWQRISKTWEEVRDEMEQEELAEELQEEREMTARQKRAEQAYAELKQSGQFNFRVGAGPAAAAAKTRRNFSGHSSSTTTVASSFRDSAIMVDERSSIESREQHPEPADSQQRHLPDDTPRAPPAKKSLFHFRTGSLSNLKKTRSEAQLRAKHTPSVSASPEKVDRATPAGVLRKAPSRKDLAKQHKLTKRVSDLETKLQEARQELNRALADAPPVPPVPESVLLAHKLGGAATAAVINPPVVLRKPFVPGALPTLPSERLLYPEQLQNNEGMVMEEEDEDEHVTPRPLKATYPSASPEKVEIDIPEYVDHEDVDIIESVELASPDIWTSTPQQTTTKPKKTAPATRAGKKRKSGDKDDLQYKPDTEEDDDAEWELSKPRTPKRKRGMANIRLVGEPAAKSKLPQPAAKPVKSVATAPKPRRSTGTASVSIFRDERSAAAAASSTTQTTTAAVTTTTTTAMQSVEQNIKPASTATLEKPASVVTTVALADEPIKPTAFATPSLPPTKRPVGTPSPRKSPRVLKTPSARRLSGSPPLAVGLSPVDENDVVRVAPGAGQAPPLPKMPREVLLGGGERGRDGVGRKGKNVQKEEWEWPEDVF